MGKKEVRMLGAALHLWLRLRSPPPSRASGAGPAGEDLGPGRLAYDWLYHNLPNQSSV